ncbi:MAG TPA: hypothetical protein VFK05_37830, partial [Polyangiaceae bacterium]|nr:hypothetical protein [Polyangiaceae bacterium]
MTNTKRWLDELPADSSERELLLVGKSARPAEGMVDANWRALCVALGTSAAASGALSTGVASNALSASASVPAQIGSAAVASKAASAGLLLMIGKSLVVGVAVGLAA